MLVLARLGINLTGQSGGLPFFLKVPGFLEACETLPKSSWPSQSLEWKLSLDGSSSPFQSRPRLSALNLEFFIGGAPPSFLDLR